MHYALFVLLGGIPPMWTYFTWQIYHDPDSPEYHDLIGSCLLGAFPGTGWWPIGILVWWLIGGPLKPLKRSGPC